MGKFMPLLGKTVKVDVGILEPCFRTGTVKKYVNNGIKIKLDKPIKTRIAGKRMTQSIFITTPDEVEEIK